MQVVAQTLVHGINLIARMKFFNCNIKIFLILSIFLGLSSSLFSQCDFTGSISVSTSGYESGVGYTQEYVLVNDDSDVILAINTTGTFSSLSDGNYRVYAVNYDGSRPTEIAVSTTWATFVANASSYCVDYIGPYSGSAVTVCEQTCSNNLTVSTSGYTTGGSFEQIYVLVNTSGTIVSSNTTGSFSSLSTGDYLVYAVNTDDAALKAEISDLGPWADVSGSSACKDILGPKYFEVVAAPSATFTVVPNCGSNEFNVEVNVSSLGIASTVNITDGVPTTYQSGVGVGTYTITGFASGSTQTIIVEDAANTSCYDSESGLTYTCSGADVGVCLGDNLSVSTSGQTTGGSFEQKFVVVNSSGNIVATNTTGTFAGLTTGDYDVYGVNTDDAALKADIDDLGAWSDISGCSTGACFDILGPKTVNVQDCSLPISLLLFNCRLNDDIVDINWVTANEINNDYFTIERSKDGLVFTPIIYTKGAGTSNGEIEYLEIDKNPYYGVSYYRLKQTDYDGSSDYSGIVTIYRKSDIANSISIYPNPFNDIITVSFSNVEINNSLIKILDISGRILRTDIIESNIYTMNLSQYPKGIYILQVSFEGENYFDKIIKQ